MKEFNTRLRSVLRQLEEEWGGDVTFIAPIAEKKLSDFEISIDWQLPEVFHYFYTKETNGLIIDNKRIYSISDTKQKKSIVDSLERANNPNFSPWFKGRPQIFKDYLIIGNDGDLIFCLSKKYDYPNPSVYVCSNANDSKGVDLNKINLDLSSLILEMKKKAFE